MRIDVFLKKVCVVKSRSLAAKLCDEGKVLIDGRPAKSSKEVKVGDEVSVTHGPHELAFCVLALPEGNVSKAQATSYYRVTGQTQVSGPFD
ncbi:MAG: RNA-binding S4 domain-containing protein [Candidatus Eisenbacteria bacterium]|nr:RNA-binding S4 domain-containing protein [Candidatus Eisenbacteria bacterium]